MVLQVHSTAGIPVRDRGVWIHFWSHCGGQPHQRSNSEEHLWPVLCASSPVPLGPHGAVAAAHAWRLLFGTLVWCAGAPWFGLTLLGLGFAISLSLALASAAFAAVSAATALASVVRLTLWRALQFVVLQYD